jgi:hypothetical protein
MVIPRIMEIAGKRVSWDHGDRTTRGIVGSLNIMDIPRVLEIARRTVSHPKNGNIRKTVAIRVSQIGLRVLRALYLILGI